MVTKAIQRRYLEAMGIPVWQQRRTSPAINIAPTSSTATPDGPAPEPTALPVADSADTNEKLAIAAAVEDEEPDRPAEVQPPASPMEARIRRIAAMDWETLQAEVQACTACALHTSRNQAVFGVGNPHAEWMIVGEAPGADEDRLGEPFVGRAGKLLDAMLRALGLQRGDVFIANILKCRPPNNRDPSFEEAHCCRPFLERQIALVRPKIVLAVGRVAAQNLLRTETPIGKLRGRVYQLQPADIPLVVSYHPAYLLRSPREKRKSWEDLQLARQTLAAELRRAGKTEVS